MAFEGTTLLTDTDLYLFNEGRHHGMQEKLGAHPMAVRGTDGTYFAVWAPNANYVSVIGDFNGWDKAANRLAPRESSGIWEGFVSGAKRGQAYKFHIGSSVAGYRADKADPYGLFNKTPPDTGSVIWTLEYAWGDKEWMRTRRARNALKAPVSIYEMHLGSWRRVPEEAGRSLTYREMAEQLPPYLRDMGFTHVEIMPVMEHPFYGSWGYQVQGYFAPTSRYGTPQDFMFLVDKLHQAGIGVILDWVPSHFPSDENGLGYFDGTHLYEHSDPRQGWHPDWNSFIFNYDRNEVRSFLISNALYWIEQYHADGLRVDAVASMLYLDYARQNGAWIPNRYGGRENIPAINFMRQLNEAVYSAHPDVQTIAEESTAWPQVSRPAYVGGLGFGLKWDMGWMHDTLRYMSKDAIHRKFHHSDLTFRMLYAFNENFILPLSHDEVVHGKGSLISKMSGDDWQKFAGLRALFGYMFAQCGKKMIFMGCEFAQWNEWYHETSLDWHLLEAAPHRGMQSWLRDLNRFYRATPSLYELDYDYQGFEWVDCDDSQQSCISLIRKGRDPNDLTLVVCNFTPVPRLNYRVGAPKAGTWVEALNSDSAFYGGSGLGNAGRVDSEPIPHHGRPCSLSITLPPLAAVFFTAPK